MIADMNPSDFAVSSNSDKPRVVVKVGSSLLAGGPPDLKPRYAFMHGLISDIVHLQKQGYEVVLTSSGSVALGLTLLRTDGSTAGVQEKQAAAACGQPILLNAYKQVAIEHGLDIAQVLLTIEDMEESRRFLNTKNTIDTLLDLGILPVVNENDSVTTEEIRVGDNDRLAAKVAQMIQADHFVILTSVPGLYDRNPDDPSAQLVEEVEDVSVYLEGTRSTNSLGTGGMYTKMQAANMAQNAGCETLIGEGIIDRPISSLLADERPHTRCLAHSTPQTAWSAWLTNRLQIGGSLVLRQDAADALHNGTGGVSCLDIVSIHREFRKADVLHVYDERGVERFRGLSNFSSDEAALLASNPEMEAETLLGYAAQPTLINRKNLVKLEEHHLPWEEPDNQLRVIAA